jgi:hypothetical protein
VIVFHSTSDNLRPYVSDLPFAVIADPDKQLYRELGIESSPWALLDPRAWPAIAEGMIRSAFLIVRHKHPVPSLNLTAVVSGCASSQLMGPFIRTRGSFKQHVFATIGAVAGLFGGGYLGVKIEGDRCHCDDPGLAGFLIGAPIGAIVGGVVGYKLGK